MSVKTRDIIILGLVIFLLLFLAFLPIMTGDSWSAANAQTVPPTGTSTATRVPGVDVPEGDTLVLLGGGLGGLSTWIGWQWRRVRRKK